jgi:hypothetical protein
LTEFRTAIDIANRACDHVGVTLIDATLGFTENSKQARRIGAVYGKLRRAELRRNVWRFAIRNTFIRPLDTATMMLAPALWVADTTYFVGSIVLDDQGNAWISRRPDNLGNQPQNSDAWDAYFGPMTVAPYDAATAYSAGELVYTAPGDGTSRVYLSLQSGNSDDPAAATAWDAAVTYSKDQVVTRASVAYMSLIDLNTNNDPASAPALWASGTTYALGDTVGASDGVIYESLGNGNVGNDPVSDNGIHWQSTGVLNPWTTVFTGGTGSIKWLQIGGAEFPNGVTLTTPNITYPLGAGPRSQDGTRNVFRLPAGYLRMAPQDPKAGSFSVLGAPSNRLYDDWDLQGDWLISQFGEPIRLRFVADVTDVATMDDMFCEGLGARVGLAVCEVITQSNQKLSAIAQSYARFIGEARLVNAIETGAVEPPLDDFIACRA